MLETSDTIIIIHYRGVHQSHNVALKVQDIVVDLRRTARRCVAKNIRSTRIVIHDVHGVARPRHTGYLSAERRVLVTDPVHNFTRTDAGHVVGIACGLIPLRHRCELSALLPCEGVVRTVIVAKRIAGAVVGDRMPVIRREQVRPLGISVGVQVRYASVRLAADVPHRIVAVAVQRRPAAVFHRRELVLPVVGVAKHTFLLTLYLNLFL